MAFVVLYDASVLYPGTLRDLLIRIAQSGLAQAKWTGEILDEMFAALDVNALIWTRRSSTEPGC